MYTYSHALLGAAIGGCLYKEEMKLRIVCAVAMTLPDWAMLVQCAWQFAHGAQVGDWWPAVGQFTAVAHSYLVIALGAWLFLWASRRPWVKMFAFGWFGHSFVDMFTHLRGQMPYWYLWPTGWDFSGFFGLIAYRTSEVFVPTWWEVGIDLHLIAIIAWQTLCWAVLRYRRANP